jgi:glycosyltransferase involved in cell wall biosynthesis
MYKRVLHRSDMIVSNAGNLTEEINRDAGKNVCTTVYRGVDIKRFTSHLTAAEAKRQLDIPPEKKVVLFVGNLSMEKGVMDLLSAFSSISNIFPNADLYLVGNESADFVVYSVIHRLGLQGRVHNVGSKPHSELPKWYNACEFLVLPSHSEGMPNVVFEAMACAKPVIATPVGGIAEVLDDKQNGFIVPVGLPTELSDRIFLLLNDSQQTESMGRNAQKKINQFFVLKKQALKMADLLKNSYK